MRAAQFPTPAELDAYAKKVADSPLTIKIFPNSVKVPQRNHVRRTVNGLDTSGHQRYSPYPPSPASAKAGLLAVVGAPIVKGGVLKDFHGGRARPESAAMNPPAGPYQVASSSTLEPHRPPPPPQQMGHAQPLHMLPQQQGPMAQSLRHPVPSMTQHPQGLPRPQTLPQALPGPHGPPGPMLHLQPPPHAPQQLRQQLPDGEAPPNVTVSTSTIPLSMVGGGCGVQRPGDLSAIVHQISQFCQARAQGAVAASVCEGQIANPSPISRSLLISACSRGGCLQLLPPENSLVAMNHLPGYHGDMKQQQQQQQQQQHLQQQHMHAQQALQQQHQQQQQQQQQMLSWNHSQHPLAHIHHVQNGCHPCGQPSRDAGFSCKGLGYGPEVCVGQPPVERPTPSPPVNVPMAPYANNSNAHYYHSHMWGGGGGGGGILPTPNSDSSGSQDLAMPFHGGAPGGTATPLDCGPPGAPHYRLGTGSCSSSTTSSSTSSSSTAAQTNLMQMADYLGGDFQTPYLRDQHLGLMGKMHRPPMSRVGLEAGDVRLVQHPGYR